MLKLWDGTGASGVAVTVITAFCENGAVLLAVIVSVAAWPTVNVLGETTAVVPGGSPLSEMAIR